MLPRLELKSASIADPVPDALNQSGSGDAVGFFSRSRARRFLRGCQMKKGLKCMRGTHFSMPSCFEWVRWHRLNQFFLAFFSAVGGSASSRAIEACTTVNAA
jgi:hypothetical protein